MIYVIAGDIGSGKTLISLDWMERAVKAGRAVYTNIELLPKCWFHDRVARIDDPAGKYPVAHQPEDEKGKPCGKPKFFWHYIVRNSLVVVDEADLYFDCSDHGRFAAEVKWFHKLSRKIDCDIVYIVQNVENLYVRIRRLASRHILCEYNWRTMRFFKTLEKLFGTAFAQKLSRFQRSEFSAASFSPASHRGDGYYTFTEASRYFGWYKTQQLMGDTSFLMGCHAGEGLGLSGVGAYGVEGEEKSAAFEAAAGSEEQRLARLGLRERELEVEAALAWVPAAVRGDAIRLICNGIGGGAEELSDGVA